MARINRGKLATEITKLEGGKVSLSVAQVSEVLRLTLMMLQAIARRSDTHEVGAETVWTLLNSAFMRASEPLQRDVFDAVHRLFRPHWRGVDALKRLKRRRCLSRIKKRAASARLCNPPKRRKRKAN